METGGRAREIGEWDSQVRRRSTSDRWIIRTARIVGKGKQQMALGPRWGVRITPLKPRDRSPQAGVEKLGSVCLYVCSYMKIH